MLCTSFDDKGKMVSPTKVEGVKESDKMDIGGAAEKKNQEGVKDGRCTKQIALMVNVLSQCFTFGEPKSSLSLSTLMPKCSMY